MATCSIIHRELKDGSTYILNNELLNWALSYSKENVGSYGIGRPLYVDTVVLWKSIGEKIGQIEDHPLRYYRFLPLHERKKHSHISFGSLYEEGKISRFMADTFGMTVVNPINPPVIGVSSTIGADLMGLIFPYFEWKESALPDIVVGGEEQIGELFTDTDGNNTKSRVSGDLQRITTYFRNYNTQIYNNETAMDEVIKHVVEPSYYEQSLQEPYYPYLLYENSGITPSQYEDLLSLVEALDVFNIGKDSSIYRLTDASLDRIKRKSLRFSTINTATMMFIEAFYEQLSDAQQEALVELVNNGETISIGELMARVGMGDGPLQEAVYRLIRGVGFLYPDLFWDTFYVDSLDRDKILDYVPTLISLLEGDTDDSTMLSRMILSTPFAAAYYEYKGALLLSEIEHGTDNMESYIDYIAILLSSVDREEAPLSSLSPTEHQGVYERIRNAFHHDNMESVDSRINALLRHYYMGKYGEQPRNLDDFSFGKCEG